MWKLHYTDAHINTVNLGNCEFFILMVCRLYTLEIFHLSLKHSLHFDRLNSFNVNKEISQAFYRTDIL